MLFNMGGGLILRIFLTSEWLLDLPDLEIFWTFSIGKNNFLPKCLFLLKNDFQTMLFLFFSILGEWVGWVLESMENSILFFFEGFPKPKLHFLNHSSLNIDLTVFVQTKYYFRNDGKGLLGHENITLILNWNVMPNMGDLKWRKSGDTHSFKLPTEYYATMKRGH